MSKFAREVVSAAKFKTPLLAAILLTFVFILTMKTMILDSNSLIIMSNTVSHLDSINDLFMSLPRNQNTSTSSNSSDSHPATLQLLLSQVDQMSEKIEQAYLVQLLSKLLPRIYKLHNMPGGDKVHMGSHHRAILIATWRSGSTFLAELLASYPATMYHYEPMIGEGVRRLRSDEDTKLATDTIKSLLDCDFKNHIDKYKAVYRAKNSELLAYNKPMWDFCKLKQTNCVHHFNFTNLLCQLHPFQIMKTVRVNLNATSAILQDPSYADVRVMLLIRDPRSTMASRKFREWCANHADCDDPGHLCQDMVEDFMVAKELKEKFPDRIMVVKYEQLIEDVVNESKAILKFLGWPYQPEIDTFLKQHCDPNVWKRAKLKPQVWNTYRDTRNLADKWKTEFSQKELMKIQGSCQLAMKLWNYQPYQPPLINDSLPASKNLSTSSLTI